jgi:hypothetical protein
MAFRIKIPTRKQLKKAVTRALHMLRINQPSRQQASMDARPKLKMSAMQMALSGVSREMAEEFADDVKAILSRQLIAWVPLNREYARRKREMGMDPRILIATGRYVNSIQPIEQKDGSWVVSVPAEPLQGSNKHTLKDLARWLEYGTRTMPARPHWRPAMQIWRTKIYQVRRRVRHDIATELKKAGFQ